MPAWPTGLRSRRRKAKTSPEAGVRNAPGATIIEPSGSAAGPERARRVSSVALGDACIQTGPEGALLISSHDARPWRTPATTWLVQALVGAVVAAGAWWVLDILVREQAESLRLGAGLGSKGTMLMLGIAAIAMVCLVIAASSFPAGLAGISILVVGVVIGGYGSGEALTVLDGDMGFRLVNGAHEPAIYMLLGIWITAVGWRLVQRRHSST